MTCQSYINLTDDFVEGLSDYLKKKDIPLEEVVEVFAGNGKLGLQLGLKENCNVSDSLLYACKGYEDNVNINWEREPYGVVAESAYETVIRFSATEECDISLLIIGAPPPANSYYCPSYDAIKALHYCFDSKILYIGEMFSHAFASPKFFAHLETVEDDMEHSFENLVESGYDNNGYFTGELFNEHVEVRPYLTKFVPCTDKECDCRDDSDIRKDIQNYASKQVRY